MTDRYDQDLLLDYLEGDLDPARRAQVDQMLADDPPLAALMRSLADDRTQLRAMPVEDAPGNLNFDLVQGLERRMLLDAPQVEPAGGPIPIQRGHGMPPPTGGWRWGRIVGLTGMAAAIAMAAGLVIWFDQFNPLSQTAYELSQPNAPAGDAAEADTALGASGAAGDATTPEMRSGGIAADAADMIEASPGSIVNSNDDDLADRARQAILDGAMADDDNARPQPLAAERGGPPAPALELTQPAGRQVTITAFAPDQALRIETDDEITSKAQMLDWCVRNGVPVVEPHLPANEGTAWVETEQQLAILIEPEQLDELVVEMNRATLTQRNNRQRADVTQADEGYYPQARGGGASAGIEALEEADGTATDNADAVVELRVPEDLGDAVQTRLNLANTLLYSNRAELALAAQRDAEVMRNQQFADESADDGSPRRRVAEPGLSGPDADPDDAFADRGHRGAAGGRNSAAGSGVGEREADDAPAENADASNAEAPMPEEGSAPGRVGADEATAEDTDPADADASDAEEPRTDGPPAAEAESPAQPTPEAEPAPRGNWLLPQVPLAPSTPIWTDPPTAQLVPIVIVRRMLEEAQREEPAEPAEDTDEAAPDADPPATAEPADE